MRRRGNIFSVFFIFLVISLIIFFFSQNGLLKAPRAFFEAKTIPLQRATFISFFNLQNKGSETELTKLRDENTKLLSQLAKQKQIEKENKALHDQFQYSEPPAKKLLPANVIGMVSFIPGVTSIDQMIIDKGSNDGVKTGNIVIVKNNLIGKITKNSAHISVINLITQKAILFTAQTLKTSALGILKGQGDQEMILDNVVLSDNLEKNDLVTSKGDVTDKGDGVPPHLVVGKIVSINKRASDVFQTAQIESLVNFSQLEMVFVIQP